jgi:hypothetical protein
MLAAITLSERRLLVALRLDHQQLQACKNRSHDADLHLEADVHERTGTLVVPMRLGMRAIAHSPAEGERQQSRQALHL